MIITRYVTIGDCALITAIIVSAVALLFVLPTLVVSGGTNVEVRSGDRVAGRYSLDEDRRVPVEGPLGTTVVRITDGHAHIESSPCPHKFCLRMGPVGGEGGLIVCVPNEVSVTVANDRADGIDAVSR
ncbi:MAG: NusG domain II-containing protein [Desulfomonilaceae bacterium]|nr:NusG domain II-containing protein [Desulfomonilaceae bacterium]